jgi:hypothetical protein
MVYGLLARGLKKDKKLLEPMYSDFVYNRDVNFPNGLSPATKFHLKVWFAIIFVQKRRNRGQNFVSLQSHSLSQPPQKISEVASSWRANAHHCVSFVSLTLVFWGSQPR